MSGVLSSTPNNYPSTDEMFSIFDMQLRMVSGPYLEFVERLPLPQFAHLRPDQLTERHRRDGFEAGMLKRSSKAQPANILYSSR